MYLQLNVGDNVLPDRDIGNMSKIPGNDFYTKLFRKIIIVEPQLYSDTEDEMS